MTTPLDDYYAYRQEGSGCGYSAARAFLLAMIAFVLVFFLASAGALVVWTSVAKDLPPAAELKQRASTFNSTRILDRTGKLLYEINDPNAGRRIVVPIQQIPKNLIEATLATEDPSFYTNPGFDVVGIARALYNVVIRGREVGGSTITQQLVKNVYERTERTLERKVSEIILANELTRQYPKDQILEIYLNEIYYGNQAYGIEAAAQTYFSKRAVDLNLAEAAFLAGLPQAPAFYDPYTNFDDAKERQRTVLNLMVQHEVVIDQLGHKAVLSSDDAVRAYNQPLSLIPLKTVNEVRAPHWSVYVRQLLEDKYGAQDLYRLGLAVTTTLDLDWQMTAERVAKTQIDKLKAQNASNAALLALDAGTGEIKAMLGSVDFFNKEIDGQVNVTLRQRQPGSSIKPVTYVAAFEKGWTPATLILDNPSKFPDKPNPDYEPRNYDGKFHGFVTARDALANSYNIPAVKTLNFVGLPDMIKMAERLGIKSFTRKDYGLSLTLGGGDVTLFELTAAYAVFANQGKRATPVSILKITDGTGKVLQEFKPAPAPEVVKPQYAYMITDILEDNAARTPAFGPNSVLKLSRPAAVKTGTTNDSRDNWTVGYTADNLVVGVWVGNNNNKAMIGTSGISGAAPIWHDFIEEVAKGKPAKQFPSVPDMVLQYICSDTGFLANDLCPHKRPEVFFKSNVPPGDFVYRRYLADRLTGQVYDERCPVNLKEERTAAAFADQEFRQWAASAWQFRAGFTAADFYKGDELRDWANDHGVPQPPKLLKASLTQPLMNNSAQGLIDLIGSVDIPDFASYITEYGVGDDPIGWGTVSPSNSTKVTNSVLAQWDSAAVPNGVYSLRVVATDKKGNKAESCTRVLVLNPTPAPTATPAFTFTPTPTTTPTPTPTRTPTPTASTTVTPASTRTPTPTLSCVPLGGGLLTPIPTLDIRCASPTPASTQTAVPTPTATPKP